MWKHGVILGVVCLLMTGSAAVAFTEVGEPIEVGSWSQQFNESGVGLFDHLQVWFPNPAPPQVGSTARASAVSQWAAGPVSPMRNTLLQTAPP